jgi:hypothetical protein
MISSGFLMRRIRDNFPAGRTVIVEYQNEPWNFAFTSFGYCTLAAYTLGDENPYTLSYYMRRSAEVGNIARAVFKETGRESEIKLMLNCQIGSDQPKNHLTYAAKNGWQVDRIGNAPYLNIDTGQNAFATWDDDQLCDLWPMFLWYDTRAGSYNGWTATAKNAIADYNKTAAATVGASSWGTRAASKWPLPSARPTRSRAAWTWFTTPTGTGWRTRFTAGPAARVREPPRLQPESVPLAPSLGHVSLAAP